MIFKIKSKGILWTRKINVTPNYDKQTCTLFSENLFIIQLIAERVYKLWRLYCPLHSWGFIKFVFIVKNDNKNVFINLCLCNYNIYTFRSWLNKVQTFECQVEPLVCAGLQVCPQVQPFLALTWPQQASNIAS